MFLEEPVEVAALLRMVPAPAQPKVGPRGVGNTGEEKERMSLMLIIGVLAAGYFPRTQHGMPFAMGKELSEDLLAKHGIRLSHVTCGLKLREAFAALQDAIAGLDK